MVPGGSSGGRGTQVGFWSGSGEIPSSTFSTFWQKTGSEGGSQLPAAICPLRALGRLGTERRFSCAAGFCRCFAERGARRDGFLSTSRNGRYAQIRTDTPRYAQIRAIRPDTPKYAQIRAIRPDTHRYVQIRPDTPRYARYAQIHPDTHRYAQICPDTCDTPRYAQI